MTGRRARIGVVAATLLIAARAAADPAPTSHVHIRSASSVHTDGGSEARLPPGWFLDEASYAALDAEMRRLQDAEVRLTAENKSFRETAASWQPGWYTLAITLAGGAALGWYVHSKL